MKLFRAVRAIAVQDMLDILRQRGTWLLLLSLPILNVLLIVVVPGVLSEREREQRTTETYTVAVDGTPEDVTTLGDVLEPALLRVVSSSDPAAAVKAKRAHVGVVVPEGSTVPDASSVLAADAGEVHVRVVALGTRATSRIALGRVVATMEAYRSQLTEQGVEARGLPASVARPVVVDAVDLATTELGARLALALTIPFLMLFPITNALAMAGQRVSGGKDVRVLEPLMLLPVPRSIVLVGKALSGYAIGVVMLPALAVPLLASRLLPAGEAGVKVALSPWTVLGVTAIGAVVLVLFVAVGTCLGAASRTSAELGALTPFVMVPIMLLALSINFLQIRTVPTLALIPLFGPTLVARDIVAGTVEATNVMVAVLVTLACAVALIGLAGRLLERERSVVRPTS